MKTGIKRTLSVLLTLVMLLTAFPLTGLITSAAGPATGVALDETSVRIELNRSKKLTATPTPAGTTYSTITWATSAAAVATVSADGTVVGVSKGTARITVSLKSTNGTTYSEICNVEVFCSHAAGKWTVTKEATYDEEGSQYRTCDVCKEVVETAVIPKKTRVTAMALSAAVVDIGGTETLVPTFTPESAANKEVTWVSSDTSTVMVNASGVVRGIKAGTATITATSKDVATVSASCVVTVCAHTRTTRVFTQPTCTAKGEDYYLCAACGKKLNYRPTDALGHSEYTSVPAKPATCTETGSSVEKKCSRCFEITVKSESTPALGHKFGTVWVADNEGSHYVTCENGCGTKNKVACTYGEGTVTQPTCTAKGYTTYTCSVCKDRAQKNEVAALGHDEEWVTTKEASYTQAGQMILRCNRCKQTLKTEAIAKWSHVVSIALKNIAVDIGGSEAIEVTFNPEDAYNKGLTWKSSNTAVATVDANGVVRGVAAGSATITATSTDTPTAAATCTVTVCTHSRTMHTETAATCSAKGESYDTCAACGKKLNYVETPMLEHQLYDVVQGKPATCTEAGYTAKKACRVCDYTEEGGINIPATGHTFSSWAYSENDKHSRKCSVCNFEEIAACTYGETATVVATCTEGGYDGRTCTVCAHISKTNEKEALGHAWSDWTKIENSNTHMRTCANDLSHTVTEECTYDKGVVTAPSCVDKGYTTYTCTVCSDTYTDEETDPVGHNQGEWKTTTEPTYEADGERKLICTSCGEVLKTEPIAKLIHVSSLTLDLAAAEIDLNNAEKTLQLNAAIAPQDASNKNITWTSSNPEVATVDEKGLITGLANGRVIITATTVEGGFTATCELLVCKHDKIVSDEAKAPTCTEDGHTVEEKCVICNKIMTASTVVPNLGGHIPATQAEVTHATCTTLGSEVLRCTQCNEVINSEVLPLLGHVPRIVTEARDATCIEPGWTSSIVCADCGAPISDSITTPPIGHTDENLDLECDVCGELLISGKTVEGLRASSNTSTSLIITWDKVAGVNGYVVYMYNAATKKYEEYTKTNNNSLKVSNLKPNSVVYFKVCPYKTYHGSNVEYGIMSNFVRTYTAPAKVTGLKVAIYNTNALKITWNKSAGARGYIIYKYNSVTKKYVAYANTTGNAYIIRDLQPGELCYFKIRAFRTAEGQNYTNEYSDFLKTATRPLNGTMAAASTASKKLTVKIQAVGATGYLIQYSTSKDFSAGVVSKYTTNANPTYSGLVSGRTYYVRVRPFAYTGSVRVFSPAYSAVRTVKVK